MRKQKQPIPDPESPSECENLLSTLQAALGKANTDTLTPPDCNFATLAIASYENNAECLDQIIDVVFSTKTTGSCAFYESLDRFEEVLSYGPEAGELLGLVWQGALHRLPEGERESMLTTFPRNPETNLFDFLGALPTVLSKISVDASKARPWFQRIRHALGNDQCDSGYWLGIDAWTERDPENANRVLGELSEELIDDQELSLGARIFAVLRRMGNDCPSGLNISDNEECWPKHPQITKRLLHHRSWVETCRWSPISAQDAERLLHQIGDDALNELNEGFTFFRFLLKLGKLPAESIDLMIDWFRRHVTPEAQPMWAYTACMAARTAIEEGHPKWTDHHQQQLLDLVLATQPIPENNGGSWMEIDQMLVALFRRNEPGTTNFLVRLYDLNPNGFRNLLDRSNRSGSAFMELAGWSGLASLFLELFSSSMPRRRLGLCLVNSGLPLTLNPDDLATINEHHIALALLQIRLDNLRPQYVCSLLIHLLPRIENGSADLKKLFEEELSYQARNLPGLCLEAFKKIKRPSPTLLAAINKADAYFDSLRAAVETPIAALHVPGLNLARAITHRRQSRIISEKAKEGSVFLQFVKSVHVIYGSEGFGSYHGGTLTNPTPFQSFSTSAEMPRLDLMDHEGLTLRRHHTIVQIRALEQRCNVPPQPDEP